MDEKKVREAIERMCKMRDAYNATLRSLPQKTRERSDYNNYVDAFLVAIEALEKQLPKKVDVWANGTQHCPVCDKDLTYTGFHICPECYQRLCYTK
jgi:hypothetical protein